MKKIIITAIIGLGMVSACQASGGVARAASRVVAPNIEKEVATKAVQAAQEAVVKFRGFKEMIESHIKEFKLDLKKDLAPEDAQKVEKTIRQLRSEKTKVNKHIKAAEDALENAEDTLKDIIKIEKKELKAHSKELAIIPHNQEIALVETYASESKKPFTPKVNVEVETPAVIELPSGIIEITEEGIVNSAPVKNLSRGQKNRARHLKHTGEKRVSFEKNIDKTKPPVKTFATKEEAAQAQQERIAAQGRARYEHEMQEAGAISRRNIAEGSMLTSVLAALGLSSLTEQNNVEADFENALTQGNLNLAQEILESSSHKNVIIQEALLQAIENRDAYRIRLLQELGADTQSILKESVKNNDVKTVSLLLKTGVDIDNAHEKADESKSWYQKWYNYIFGSTLEPVSVRITEPTEANVARQAKRNKNFTEKIISHNNSIQEMLEDETYRDNALAESLGEHIDNNREWAQSISDRFTAFNDAHPDTRSEQEQEYQNNFDGQSSDLMNDITATLSALDDRSDEEKEEDRNNAQEALDSSFDMYF